MSKKRQDDVRRLDPLLDDPPELARLLLRESGLPGPRANLELAAALADAAAARGPMHSPWHELLEWAARGADEAPTNHPAVYLTFCGLLGLAALHRDADSSLRGRIVAALDRAAEDERWRVREAAAMGLQRIGERDVRAFLALVARWAEAPSLKLQRAALVALAHPPLLGEAAVVEQALGWTDGVLRRFEQRAAPAAEEHAEDWVEDDGGESPRGLRRQPRPRARRQASLSEDERVLTKALEFAPSVLVAAAPEPGFAMLRRWARSSSPAVQRSVAANLRKARLARRFPEQVEEVAEALGANGERT